MLTTLAIFACVLIFDEHAAHANVAKAKQHVGVSGRAVATGAPELLIIRLKASGQVSMKDKAHVWFVDAHAKRNCCGHDQRWLGHESVLIGLARFFRHAGMVGARRDTVSA